MCRLVGWAGDRPRTLREVLGDEALARFVDLSCVHANGWGLAYADGVTGELRGLRSTLPAREDPDFLAAADIASPVGLVHLRWASPGFDLRPENTHPFLADGWAMIHNGSVEPSAEVRRLRSPDSGRRPAGTTDSENLFLAVLDELDRLGGGAPRAGAPAGADLAAVDLAAAVAAVSDRAVAAGLSASSVNSMYLAPGMMHVLNWHDPARTPSIDADDPAVPPYYDLRHRHLDGLDVVASTGFVSNPRGWAVLPNASVLSIGADGSSVSRPVRPVRGLCPIPA